MVNINGCKWENVQFNDIETSLSERDNESIFFEKKNDCISNKDLVKEVSAFANTYGGYIFLGVEDDNTITGCTKWTENRIHNVIRDSISPTPVIDVKVLSKYEKTVIIIKISEGESPPYIANNGVIYERLSSGSYPINDSKRIDNLYMKNEANKSRIANLIENPRIIPDSTFPRNICAVVDLGFSIVTNEDLFTNQDFFELDLTPVANRIRETKNSYNISRVGSSYIITVGDVFLSDNGLLQAGLHNYIQINLDGSCSCRTIVSSESGTDKANIGGLLIINDLFKDIYALIINDEITNKFVYAYKYQKFDVIKQFEPYYNKNAILGLDKTLEERYKKQCKLYGGVRVISGNRIPTSGFNIIDRALIESLSLEFTNNNILDVLFHSQYVDVGYIVPVEYIPDNTH